MVRRRMREFDARIDQDCLPSPTKNWYSGPDGVVRMLFVSIIGTGVPAGRPL